MIRYKNMNIELTFDFKVIENVDKTLETVIEAINSLKNEFSGYEFYYEHVVEDNAYLILVNNRPLYKSKVFKRFIASLSNDLLEQHNINNVMFAVDYDSDDCEMNNIKDEKKDNCTKMYSINHSNYNYSNLFKEVI